jgi:nucleoside-diphosphate-sugar epimerase
MASEEEPAAMSDSRALVVGGTGPTGPFLVDGLLKRGYDVTIFHRGTHEVDEIPPQVHHIHGDPHFPETIEAALDGQTWDVTIATYGRIRHVAAALVGRTGRFLAVGGMALYRGFLNPDVLVPPGLKVPVPEDTPTVDDAAEQAFAAAMHRTELAVFEYHPDATVFRYPYVYGPYQIIPREWSIVKRLLDGRRRLLLPDGGLRLETHGWAGNLAHSVLLALDQPEAAAGRTYNCGDLEQLDLRQVILVLAAALDRDVELIDVPYGFAGPGNLQSSLGTRYHQVMDLFSIRSDLGYTDLLSSREAMARTARWYVEHPPEQGGHTERQLGDPFDYEAEDRLIDLVLDAHDRMAELALSRTGEAAAHPYPHPKEAGMATDHHGR